MYCPLCGAEYRPGFTVCSDCQVALVPDSPRGASANPSAADVPEGSSFALLWSGSDARIHAEIREALEQQKIPARTLGSDDHLFNLTTRPAYEVYVPADLINSAQEAIEQIVAREESEQPSDLDLLEIPAEEGLPDQSDYEEEEERRELNLDPQDATVEVWSGQDSDMAAMITSSLRENHIIFRADSDVPEFESAPDEMSPTRVFVFPEDEKPAKAIVREIIDAIPPE